MTAPTCWHFIELDVGRWLAAAVCGKLPLRARDVEDAVPYKTTGHGVFRALLFNLLLNYLKRYISQTAKTSRVKYVGIDQKPEYAGIEDALSEYFSAVIAARF